jgi:hypothetical protein
MQSYAITHFFINRVGITWWMSADQLSVYLPLTRLDMEKMIHIEQLPKIETLHTLLYRTEPIHFSKVRLMIERDKEGIVTIKGIEPILSEYDLLEPIMPEHFERDIDELREEIQQLKASKNEYVRQRRYEDAARIYDREKQLHILLKRMEKGLKMTKSED